MSIAFPSKLPAITTTDLPFSSLRESREPLNEDKLILSTLCINRLVSLMSSNLSARPRINLSLFFCSKLFNFF